MVTHYNLDPALEEKINDHKISEVNEIVDSQAILNEIVVKNFDYIVLIKKIKHENDDLIKTLEARIDILDKETQKSYNKKEGKCLSSDCSYRHPKTYS